MDFYRSNLETCGQASGMVVVIDVLRAFTTAAYALGQGVKEIYLTGTVDEALEIKQRFPETYTMGEVDGAPVPLFDFSNSPSEIALVPLEGKRLVHRSTAGTNGVVRSTQAGTLLTGSFVVAGATARYIQRVGPPAVTFVLTGAWANGKGDEDAAFADYLEALLRSELPDPEPYLERVRQSQHGQSFGDPLHPQYPAADMELATRLDAFDFAMPVQRLGDLWVLRKEVA